MPRSNSSYASSRSSRSNSSTGSMSNFANQLEEQMMEKKFKNVVKDPTIRKLIENSYRENTERKLNLLMKHGPKQKRPAIRHKQKALNLTDRLALALSTKMALKKRQPRLAGKRSKKKVNPLLRIIKTIRFKKK